MFKLGNTTGGRLQAYRCVYCKTRVISRDALPSHEAICPLRATVRAQWFYEIETARRREKRDQAESERTHHSTASNLSGRAASARRVRQVVAHSAGDDRR